jgi:hypothetical protein
VKLGERFIFEMADGRNVSFKILDVHGLTRVEIVFDAESQNPLELQRQGWQAILDNFKNYTESQSF